MACALLIFPLDSKEACNEREKYVSNLGWGCNSSEKFSPKRGRTECCEQRIHRQRQWQHLRLLPIMSLPRCRTKAADPVGYKGLVVRLSASHCHNRKCPHSSLVPSVRERPGWDEDDTNTCGANLLRKKVGFSRSNKCKTKSPTRLAVIFGLQLEK
jgi:hypothetical protein